MLLVWVPQQQLLLLVVVEVAAHCRPGRQLWC
jgi:hypothetical protein